MPLPWVRLDSNMPSNPKILALLDGEKEGHRAAFAWACALAYSGGHGTDGFIPKSALPFVHCRPADADKLVRHRLWEAVPGGWVINGWVEFQQSTEETRERSRKAREAARRGNCVRWHGPGCVRPECQTGGTT